MTALEIWLNEATRCLASESSTRVREEIREHYEFAREAAISSGVTAAEVDRAALAALGDAKTANRQYHKVLLTSSEAKLLREEKSEVRFVCSHPSIKYLLFMVPIAAPPAALVAYFAGAFFAARILLAAGIMFAFFLAPSVLPRLSPSAANWFRIVKWAAVMGALLFALDWSWLATTCLWPMASSEWTRASIRRKMPVTAWPKQLYF